MEKIYSVNLNGTVADFVDETARAGLETKADIENTYTKSEVDELVEEAATKANDGILTIQKNGTTVQTFTANQATNATANITVPVNLSELTADATHRLVTDTEKTKWNNKADASSVITVTLLASGWTNNTQTVTATGIKASSNGVVGMLNTATAAQLEAAMDAELTITTIDTNSVTFICENEPQIDIPVGILSGGGGGGGGGGGTTDYADLDNKPQIGGVTLSGNKSLDDLSIQHKLTAGTNITIQNNVISSTGGGLGTKLTSTVSGDTVSFTSAAITANAVIDDLYIQNIFIGIVDKVINGTTITYTLEDNSANGASAVIWVRE